MSRIAGSISKAKQVSRAHRDSGCVYETFVEMRLGGFGVVFRLKANKPKFAEFAILGEFQAAIGQRAKGGEEVAKAFFLDL